MREHQIVITLKPDQFLEVQRLSRAANAKSMGIFVRQKLLAALGIEGVLKTEDASAVDVEQILGDLQRLHGELKSFVAESLSPYSIDAFAPVDPEENPELEQLSLFVQDEAVSPAVNHAPIEDGSDNLEQSAERAFAISPRLGEIGDPEPIPAPEVLPPVTEPQPASAPVRTPHELVSRHEGHSRRDVHRYNHPHAASEFMDVPFGSEPDSADKTTSQQSANIPPASLSAAIEAVSEQPPKRAVVDPLSKLLSNEELSSRPVKPRLEAESSEDAFQVPLSIAARRKEQSSNDVDDEFVPPNQIDPTAAAVMAAQDAMAATVTGADVSTPIITESSILATTPNTQDNETVTPSASSQTEPPPNELTRPLGYPPLSGSPPPKRRQV